MNRRKIAIWAINVLLLLIWIGLIGVTFWPLSALYGTRVDWWSGNSAMDAMKYVVWGPLAGMLGMGVHLYLLQKRRKTPIRLKRSILIGAGLIAGVLTSFCLPYFIIPDQVGAAARAEFAATWGADWESRIRCPRRARGCQRRLIFLPNMETSPIPTTCSPR